MPGLFAEGLGPVPPRRGPGWGWGGGAAGAVGVPAEKSVWRSALIN